MILERIIFVVLSGLFAIFFFASAVKKIGKLSDNRRYGNLPSGLLFAKRVERLRRILYKIPGTKKVIEELTLKCSVLNALSYEKNSRIAVCVFAGAVFLFLLLSAAAFIISMPYWYMALIYITLGAAGLLFAFIRILSISTASFLKHMPETLKILNSRYSSRGNIVKALHVSIADFHKSIRNEMLRIYDALKQNEAERIRETFSAIDRKYGNEHMTLLLELIWFAHYNGGETVIRTQFDEMIRDVIEDIENRHDLHAVSFSYTAMCFGFLFAVPAVRWFNGSILDNEAMKYYESRMGILVMTVYFILIAVLIFMLAYSERAE